MASTNDHVAAFAATLEINKDATPDIGVHDWDLRTTPQRVEQALRIDHVFVDGVRVSLDTTVVANDPFVAAVRNAARKLAGG
jgi:hypothetical protein